MKLLTILSVIIVTNLLMHCYIFLIYPFFVKKNSNLISKKKDFFLSWITSTFFFCAILLLFYYINEPSLFTKIIFKVLIMSVIPFYNSAIKPIFYSFLVKKKEISMYKDWLKGKGYEDYKIYSLDTSIINAFAVGFLPNYKIIIIGKIILDNMDEKQIKSLILHEIGHHEKKHLIKIFRVFIFISMFIASLYVFLNQEVFNGNKWITIIICNGLYGLLIYYSLYFQKKMEFEADIFSAKQIGKDTYIDFLVRLNEMKNNSMDKNSLSHPTLTQRISYINEKI